MNFMLYILQVRKLDWWSCIPQNFDMVPSRTFERQVEQLGKLFFSCHVRRFVCFFKNRGVIIFFFFGATFSLTLLFKNPKIGFLKMDFWAPSEKPIREVFVLAPLADAATSGMMRRQKATKKVHETWSRKVDATKCHLKILQNYFCFPGSFLNLHVFFCQI